MGGARVVKVVLRKAGKDESIRPSWEAGEVSILGGQGCVVSQGKGKGVTPIINIIIIGGRVWRPRRSVVVETLRM